jgi:acetate kinase
MPNAILALNAGSSSLKFALFGCTADGEIPLLARGEIEEIDHAPIFTAQDGAGVVLEQTPWPSGSSGGRAQLLGRLLGWTERHLGGKKLIAVGHRVVHGGRDFSGPVLVTDAVMTALEGLTPLAPLHQPNSLAPIRAITRLQPDLPQIACFDTAFHHGMPAVATRFALPRIYEDEGVRRYGFHGLSYEYIARQLQRRSPALFAGRVVVAHLGSGASLCAMRNGQSVETSMGFTALDGLVMATRCGTIDPGVLLYLAQQKGLSATQIEHMLYEQSGLLGLSGVSGDMRVLLSCDDERAKQAIELFVYRIGCATAALAAALGGIDGFVFTAGIGEHAPEIRAAICERLRWLGASCQSATPPAGSSLISAPGSAIEVHVIATDEEATIGRHTLESLPDSAIANV